jgi:hypothetical protein
MKEGDFETGLQHLEQAHKVTPGSEQVCCVRATALVALVKMKYQNPPYL